MRRFLLAAVACLAVLAAGVRAQEPVDDEDTHVEVDDIDNLDLSRMLGDLFDTDDESETPADDDDKDVDATDREARAKGDNKDSEVDLTRYNNFIDTVIRRINSYSRSRFDPLSIGLAKKDAREGKAKGGKGKGGKGKKNKDGKKGGKKDGKGKKGKGKDKGKDKGKGKGKGKKEKGKKTNRHPKDLKLDEDAAEGDPELAKEAEEKVANTTTAEVTRVESQAEATEGGEKTGKEEEEETAGAEEETAGAVEETAAEDEESGVVTREKRDVDEGDADTIADSIADSAVVTSRKGKPAGTRNTKGGKNKGKKDKVKDKDEDKTKEKGKGKGKGKGKKGKGKKGKGKKGKKGGKKGGSKSRTSRASVSGLATLRREGNVKVINKKDGKEIRSQFKMGPVDLKVSRKFGAGKDSVTRTARAASPQLDGKLYIFVSSDGKAKVTKFHVARPAIVQVDGNLRKDTRDGKADNNFMEKSISRVIPVASLKLQRASKAVLSASEPKSSTTTS